MGFSSLISLIRMAVGLFIPLFIHLFIHQWWQIAFKGGHRQCLLMDSAISMSEYVGKGGDSSHQQAIPWFWLGVLPLDSDLTLFYLEAA